MVTTDKEYWRKLSRTHCDFCGGFVGYVHISQMHIAQYLILMTKRFISSIASVAFLRNLIIIGQIFG